MSSFFLWFCDDEEESRLWFTEAEKVAGRDAFAYFQIFEAHHALLGSPSEEMKEMVRRYGQECVLEDQIVLLEELEDRLGIREEKWISQCSHTTTKDWVLWCRSRFSKKESKEALDRYCRDIEVQLKGFSISVVEPIGWDNVEEKEKKLSDQIQLLAGLNQQNKIYKSKGFVPPPLVPPFSNVYLEQRVEHLIDLQRQRSIQIEEQRRKDAQKDGIWILVLSLCTLGAYIGFRWLV